MCIMLVINVMYLFFRNREIMVLITVADINGNILCHFTFRILFTGNGKVLTLKIIAEIQDSNYSV